MSASKLAVGLVVPTTLGAALGFGLGPMTAGLSTEPMAVSSFQGPDPTRAVFEEVSGEVWVRSGQLDWHPVAEGEKVPRPVSIKTVGIDGYARLSAKGARVVVARDAVVHIGAPGVGFTVQVDRGLMLTHRAKQQVQTILPAQEVDVSGRAYGVWVRPDRVHVAVLDGEAEIRSGDGEAERFSSGREVTIRKGTVEPSLMASRLTLELITDRRYGSRTKLAARTSINARVYQFGRSGFAEIDVSRGGTFTTYVPGTRPDPGTLIALDAAGRWAELDRPSRRLQQVLQDLETGERHRSLPSIAAGATAKAKPSNGDDQGTREDDGAETSALGSDPSGKPDAPDVPEQTPSASKSKSNATAKPTADQRVRVRSGDHSANKAPPPGDAPSSTDLPEPPPIGDADEDLDEEAL